MLLSYLMVIMQHSQQKHTDMLLSVKKTSFLCTNRNKKQLIKLLCQKLLNNNIESIQVETDAYVLAVKTATDFVKNGKKTVIAG